MNIYVYKKTLNEPKYLININKERKRLMAKNFFELNKKINTPSLLIFVL